MEPSSEVSLPIVKDDDIKGRVADRESKMTAVREKVMKYEIWRSWNGKEAWIGKFWKIDVHPLCFGKSFHFLMCQYIFVPSSYNRSLPAEEM